MDELAAIKSCIVDQDLDLQYSFLIAWCSIFRVVASALGVTHAEETSAWLHPLLTGLGD